MNYPERLSKKLVSDVYKLMSGGTITAVTEKEVVETQELIEEKDTEEVVDSPDFNSYDTFDSEFEYIFFDGTLSMPNVLEQTEDYVEIMAEDAVVRIPASDVLVEEVEDLSEISKEKLKSYTNAAQADPAFAKKRGKPAKNIVAVRTKRTKGLEAAKTKLQAIYKKESEIRQAHLTKLNNQIDDHFENNHAEVLAKHGFTPLHSGTHLNYHGKDLHIKTYTHKHDNGHVSLISVHKNQQSNPVMGYKHEVKAVNTKGSSWSSHHPNSGLWDEDKFEDRKKEMLPKFENHVIDIKKSGNDSHW